MERLQLLKVRLDTFEAEIVSSIPYFVCILLLFGSSLIKTIGWEKMVYIK